MSANTVVSKTIKSALRKRIKTEILTHLTPEVVQRQSQAVMEKVLQSDAFRQAKRVSIYLSTGNEIDTNGILREMFRLEKQVYVPTYDGDRMEMLRLRDLHDYNTLPLTKWQIKQPDIKDARENALTNGHGCDLFLMPGVAFTKSGSRLGHGKGYYDQYLRRHFETYPQKKVTLMALAFREQIVADDEIPMDAHDVRLHSIITE